jgi:hypothetical protein
MPLICNYLFDTLPKLQTFVFVPELVVAAQQRLGFRNYQGTSVWVKINSGEAVCLTFPTTTKLEITAISPERRQQQVVPINIMGKDDLHALIAQAKLGERLFQD